MTRIQIAIGAHLLTAHRGQIELSRKSERRRNVSFQVEEKGADRRGQKRKYTTLDDEEPFRGFEQLTETSPARSELHPEALEENMKTWNAMSCQPVAARKSSRRKNKKTEREEFLYY